MFWKKAPNSFCGFLLKNKIILQISGNLLLLQFSFHRLETTHWISSAPFSSIPTCRGGWSVEAEEVAPLLKSVYEKWTNMAATFPQMHISVSAYKDFKKTPLMYNFQATLQ